MEPGLKKKPLFGPPGPLHAHPAGRPPPSGGRSVHNTPLLVALQQSVLRQSEVSRPTCLRNHPCRTSHILRYIATEAPAHEPSSPKRPLAIGPTAIRRGPTASVPLAIGPTAIRRGPGRSRSSPLFHEWPTCRPTSPPLSHQIRPTRLNAQVQASEPSNNISLVPVL